MLAATASAPPVFAAPDAEVVLDALEEPDAEAEEAGAVELAAALEPEAAVVAAAEELAPEAEEAVDADDAPEEALALAPMQLELPALILKGAHWLVAPVLSLMVRLTCWLLVMFVGQVKLVPSRGPYCWRGAPEGSLPGSMLR